MVNEQELRNGICEIGRRLYAKNLVSATDGNISARLGSGRFLCTPSGVSKGFMQPGDLVVADDAGGKVAGDGTVSSEFFTHLAAYEERADVAAVVHAHPPKAVGLMLAGIGMSDPVLPEVLFALGAIPTASYATPGTREGADSVRPLVRDCDALLLDRHGALTLGPDLATAYWNMEKLEHAAESLWVAHTLGRARPLSADECARIAAGRGAYGITGKIFPRKLPE